MVKGMSYDKAHERAGKVEQKFRKERDLQRTK